MALYGNDAGGVVKLKSATQTYVNSSGVLIESSLVKLTCYSAAQFLYVYDSTNTTLVASHIIGQYETLYLVKEADQYLRCNVTYGTPVAIEG
tara:strand:+ start:3004 stop:3279 length:276 start_codon:yes stop_codon:yes gene_type:complete